MPELDTAAIRARLDGATPGPWKVVPCYRVGHCADVDTPEGWLLSADPADAEFIAHAPSDIAALLEENERLTSALTRVGEALGEHLEAAEVFATMPAVGDHGDTRWGEGYKRASEQEVDALRPILAIVTAALDGAHPTPSDGSGTDG